MKRENANILILDDDVSYLEQMPDILEGLGQIDCYPTIDQGLAAIRAKYYDVVVLDLNFENDKRSGLDVFRNLMALDSGIEVLMITGETDPRRIFELVNAGVKRFLPKLSDILEIREQVCSILEERAAKKMFSVQHDEALLVGSSPAVQKIREQIKRIVDNGIKDVLIQGETGTGKEVVARLIASSADKSGRFLPVNCGAMNENLIQSALFGHVRGAFTGADKDKKGIFEAAGGGYVFLDEIGDMPLSQQPKLLRALQERKIQRLGEIDEKDVNFRTISATHVDLKKAVVGGKFREDLYFRISKEIISIPPLRERSEDIRELIAYFLSKQSKQCSITEEAVQLLLRYRWPGNTRELEGVIESVVTRCDGVIRAVHVLAVIPELAALTKLSLRDSAGNLALQCLASERKRFSDAIIEANGDRDLAAEFLGMSRATFYRKAKELGISKTRRQRSLEIGIGVQN